MCDHGRLTYRWMNRGDRIEAPLVKRDGSALHATDWDEAFQRAATLLRGASGRAVALVSPRASTEALFLARELFSGFDWVGAFQVVMGEAAPLPGVPNLALRAERAPNATGAELGGGWAPPGGWVFRGLRARGGGGGGGGEHLTGASDAFRRLADAAAPF